MAEVKAHSIEEAKKLVGKLASDQYSTLCGSDEFHEGEVKEVK